MFVSVRGGRALHLQNSYFEVFHIGARGAEKHSGKKTLAGEDETLHQWKTSNMKAAIVVHVVSVGDFPKDDEKAQRVAANQNTMHHEVGSLPPTSTATTLSTCGMLF